MVAIVVGTLWSASASAQTTHDTFQQLREAGQLESGDSFVVKRRDGTHVTGKLEALAPGTLRLKVRGDLLELSAAEVERIERRDSAADGAWLGFFAGAGVLHAWSIPACRYDPEACGYAAYYLTAPVLVGGTLVGYVVDRALQDVVFDATAARAKRISVSPVVSRHHRGATLSVSW